MAEHAGWPALPLAHLESTRDTVQLWTQIVGKVRLALEPAANHWWNVSLYVNAVGLTTSLMPNRGLGVEMTFDVVGHQLLIRTTDGRERRVALQPRTVTDFYAEFRARLAELDLDVPINPKPVEVVESIPFADDVEHASYDPDAMHRFWTSLVSSQRVFSRFRGEFRGKASPVHFFRGAFDLAVTRFSGRPHHIQAVSQLPRLGDARGLLRRGLQLWLLARRRRRRGLLLLRLPRAGRVPRPGGRTTRGPLR